MDSDSLEKTLEVQLDNFVAQDEHILQFAAEHLVGNPEAGMPDKKGYPQGPLTLDYQRIVPWAFISWNAKGGQL